jgi:hypothetical protein
MRIIYWSDLFPPRRSKDLVHWKIKSIDNFKDNYFDKSSIHYNSYKTAKCYGEQIVQIPTDLKNIINKWNRINPNDYLLFDTNMNPLISVKLNQRLNKLFDGKKVGVNQLRHTYLTDKYANTMEQKKKIDKDTLRNGPVCINANYICERRLSSKFL